MLLRRDVADTKSAVVALTAAVAEKLSAVAVTPDSMTGDGTAASPLDVRPTYTPSHFTAASGSSINDYLMGIDNALAGGS